MNVSNAGTHVVCSATTVTLTVAAVTTVALASSLAAGPHSSSGIVASPASTSSHQLEAVDLQKVAEAMARIIQDANQLGIYQT